MTDALGIFGGTFDPIHRGHLAIATSVVEGLDLARLLLVPASEPPHKPGVAVTDFRHRLAMVAAACEPLDRIEVSAVEQERSGPSFTVDTLEYFRNQEGPKVPLVFVMGSDSLAELPLWKDHRRILELAHVLVAPRPGLRREEALAGLGPDLASRVSTHGSKAALEEPTGSILWLDWTPLDISGSRIRRMVASGEPIEELVPSSVAAYISRYRIYPEPRSHV